MNEKDAKFFRPLWIRVLVTGFVIAWFGFETIVSHDSMWMTITGAGVAYCVWTFFIRFPKDAPATPDEPKQP